MSQDQRLQQVLSVLREKTSQFDTNKERSKKQILDGTQELRDQINTAEAGLLRKIDTAFGENPFAAALADVESYNNGSNTSVDCNKLERVSREAVPPVTGPSEEDFYKVQKAILKI